MKIRILGGGQEVGRSAIQVQTKNASIIMDYGVKIEPAPGEFPLVPDKVDAIIPTHSHLDHCGAVPVLARHKAPVFTTSATAEMSELLINDFLKIARINQYPQRFTREDARKIMNSIKAVKCEKPFSVKDASIKLFDAGHIPGSAGVLLSSGKKNIFYTGDIKLSAQKLVSGCRLPKEKVSTLIIESTYSDRNHPDVHNRDALFRSEIDEALNMNEHVIIPVFAVGRAQEILLNLKGYENYVALDGMAKEATRIILKNSKCIRNSDELKNIFRKIRKIDNVKQREAALKKPSIIVTTSGMLSGGPVAYYLRKIQSRRDSKVIIVGFQVEGSPGKQLLDTNIYKNENEEFAVRCRITRFDFSSHAGRGELLEIIRKIKPEQVICVHGDKCPQFARDIEREFRIPAFAPKNGDEIEI